MIPHQQLKTLFITLGILLLNLSVVVVQGDYHSNANANANANANTNANLDKLDNCQELALDGKCETDLENMQKNCHQTCQQRTEEKLQFRLIKLQESFYDLSATKATAGTNVSTSKSSSSSSVIDFERFEGYVTLIIPLAKLCSQHMAVTPKSIFESIEKLKELYSYSLEVLVFPYEHPSVSAAAEAAIANGDTDANTNINNDCSEFESLMVQDRSSSKKKKGSNNRQIYVFEESNLKQKKIKPTKGDDNNNEEGEEEETVIPVHPVFQYFLDEMGMEELPFDTQFYFIVLPDGDKAYFQYGKSLLDIQDIVSELVRSLGGKEL